MMMPSGKPATVGKKGLALVRSEQGMVTLMLLVPDTSAIVVREGRQRQRRVTPTRRERQKRQRDAWEFPGLAAVLCCSHSSFFMSTCSALPHLEHHPTSQPGAHTSHMMSYACPRPHPSAPSPANSHSCPLPFAVMFPGFGAA